MIGRWAAAALSVLFWATVIWTGWFWEALSVCLFLTLLT